MAVERKLGKGNKRKLGRWGRKRKTYSDARHAVSQAKQIRAHVKKQPNDVAAKDALHAAAIRVQQMGIHFVEHEGR